MSNLDREEIDAILTLLLSYDIDPSTRKVFQQMKSIPLEGDDKVPPAKANLQEILKHPDLELEVKVLINKLLVEFDKSAP